MNRGSSMSIGDVLSQCLCGTELEKSLLETRVVEQWPQVMGDTIARLTSKIEVKDGVLYVHIRSAALKSQLFECRFDLVRKLNEAVGGSVLRDVRLLG